MQVSHIYNGLRGWLSQRWYMLYVLPWDTHRFSYELPTYLVSYPRSGSNFLQNVLRNSSGFKNTAIYKDLEHPHSYLSLKTHALSYMHLLGEIGRFAPALRLFPGKLIVLWRDPRDVMISFYEFLQARQGRKLEQMEFLYQQQYYRPVLGFESESVLHAYKTFTQNWFSAEPPSENSAGVPATWIEVRFERLVLEPNTEFQKIFDYLELDCTLNTRSLSRKVSQISETERPRGMPGSWKYAQDEYAELVATVNRDLADEIQLLGYDI